MEPPLIWQDNIMTKTWRWRIELLINPNPLTAIFPNVLDIAIDGNYVAGLDFTIGDPKVNARGFCSG
jgi:hypothetical protein